MSRLVASILLAVPAFVALARQTQQKPPSHKISVEVKLVRISATVRDKHKTIVPNLNKEDFVLQVEGHLQPVDNFIRQRDLPLTLGLLVQASLGQRRRYALHNTSDASFAFLDQMLRVDKDKVFMVGFGRNAELLQSLTSSRAKLHAALELMQTRGFSNEGTDGTLLYDGICLASRELMRTQQGRTALVVVSDGIDRGSEKTLEDALEASQQVDTPVYSILVTENWPGPNVKRVLERISTQTGGHPFKIFHGLTVAQIYAQAEEELRNQYVLMFTPTPTETGMGYHRIHLTTKKKDLTVQARGGYYSDQWHQVKKLAETL